MIQHNEMLATMVDVAERLNSLNIEYMVTGSFAMSAYVPARTTYDIDIVLEIAAADSERFERRFAGDYYVAAPSIVRAAERQSMFNIVNSSTVVKVDCIVRKNDRLEIERFGRRRRSKIGGIDFWVIGKEDLILSKLRWASESRSERQFEDIRQLHESGTDEEFLVQMIEQADLYEVWHAYQQWTTQAAK